MYKRDEAARLKEEFWTAFGRYMNPVPSAEGLKINWINYRTAIKDVHFRMDASSQSAIICISLEHADADIRELYYQQFQELKVMLHTTLAEAWEWQLHTAVTREKVVSRIYKELTGVSVFNKEHWPDLITFFKPRIIALDQFWQEAQYSIKLLE